MRYLFTQDGHKLLESLCFTRTLFAFDFDGTLSKIVNVPSDACLTRETSRLLGKLAHRAPVAIISGRSITDLKSRLDLRPKFMIGNHGLEGLAKFAGSEALTVRTCKAWKEQLEKSLFKKQSRHLPELEDKHLSLALHYRKSRNKRDSRLAIFKALTTMTPPPRVIPGKCVINLVPPGGPHKGIALLEAMLQENVKSAFYIGDDDTDEDVFSLPDARVLTVRVGNKKSSNAGFYIRRQSDMNRLLRLLLQYLPEPKSFPRA